MPEKSLRIFISYRRDDARGYAGWLEESLERRYPGASVFLDVGDIDIGTDFPERITSEINAADVILCLIGSRWHGHSDAWMGKPRLHHPQDWVRREVAGALEAEGDVLPILLDGVPMPSPKDLPNKIKRLATRNAHPMALATWQGDFEKLCEHLDGLRRAKLKGKEIIVRRKDEHDAPTWVGRAQGLRGKRFQDDVRTGKWRDQAYEVAFGRRRPNDGNWFSVDEFEEAVAAEHALGSNGE